jgi:hypothetical protein
MLSQMIKLKRLIVKPWFLNNLYLLVNFSFFVDTKVLSSILVCCIYRFSFGFHKFKIIGTKQKVNIQIQFKKQ